MATRPSKINKTSIGFQVFGISGIFAQVRKLLYILPFFAASCQYIDRVPSEEQLLRDQLKTINWKQVDQYPSVADCESLDDKNQQRQCFFDFLTAQIQQKLPADTLARFYPNRDTIEVKITIFPDSSLKFEPQFPRDSVAYDTIRIDSILRARLVGFPKINPAIKRGIPVKSQFVLPVMLKMQ
jgi:hypothetical protein